MYLRYPEDLMRFFLRLRVFQLMHFVSYDRVLVVRLNNICDRGNRGSEHCAQGEKNKGRPTLGCTQAVGAVKKTTQENEFISVYFLRNGADGTQDAVMVLALLLSLAALSALRVAVALDAPCAACWRSLVLHILHDIHVS